MQCFVRSDLGPNCLQTCHQLMTLAVKELLLFRGGSRISGKGDHMYKGLGSSLCRFYLIFLIYPMNMK